MKNKLIKAMIVVLLIQVTLFVIAIFGGNTIQNLSLEYINILESRVLLRKNYIEDEMLQRWSNIGDLENYIQNKAKELGVQDDPALVPQLLKDVADQSVVSLRKTGVTEVFVILEGEKGHQGIHLRDLDPLFNTSDNSDILMERGSIDIAKNIGASLDSEWSNKFNLSQEDKMSEYYYKPFLAVESHPNLSAKDLAYWSKPFKLSPDDIEIITYSIPLINEKGKAYGVIGVGLTADYLSEKLKYDELNDNKRGFYTLSVNDEKAKSDKKVVSSGPMYDV